MKYIKKIKTAIKKKLAYMVFPDIIRLIEIEKKAPQIPYHKFKSFGKNSFFWGKIHFISGYENINIGTNVHINNNVFIRGEGGVTIGDNTHISRNLVLYSINHDFNGELIPYDDQLVKKPVKIGPNVWIGMNVCITPGTTIGEGCIIGMGTVVSGEVPPLTIVGSQKWRKIGNRNSDHYNYLVKNEMYGGIDGKYYKANETEILDKIGNIYNSQRSISQVILINEKKFIKKVFLKNPSGLVSFQKEKEAYLKFEKFQWCPQVFEIGEDYLIFEFIENKYRLDGLSDKTDWIICGEILWCLIDIFNSGYAHCDFHAKNIFVTPGGIKITDFETIELQDQNLNFYDSYDVTGKGLKSPFATNNMCVFNDSPFSIGSVFKITSLHQLKQIINNRFKIEALKASESFYSNLREENRAFLQVKNVYSSFSLKNIYIPAEESQRNTQIRFKNFEICENGVKNKTVLDIGSNIGGILLGLTDYGIRSGTGIEIDEEKVRFANKLSRFNNILHVNFIKGDIERKNSIEEFDKQFDVVFCLAVLEHLKNKDFLFSFISKVCLQTLFFEGNENTSTSYVEDQLRLAGFNQITYLGLSSDEKNEKNNKRPMWKASRI